MWIKLGYIIYIHCWGCIGRTGAIVGYHCMVTKVKILTKLKKIWSSCKKSSTRNSPETPAKEKYIFNWNEEYTPKNLEDLMTINANRKWGFIGRAMLAAKTKNKNFELVRIIPEQYFTGSPTQNF